MTDTEISESDDGTITVSERPDESERNEQSLKQLVTAIRDDPNATDSEKRLASALSHSKIHNRNLRL